MSGYKNPDLTNQIYAFSTTWPQQRLNMLQLITHLRLLGVLEVDGGFAEAPGQA